MQKPTHILFFFLTVMLNSFQHLASAQGTWTQKANFGGSFRESAVGFSIGNKGYIGTGRDSLGNYSSDFWEYDPILDSWSQKANVPGGNRKQAVGFSIGSKGYIGTGDKNITGPSNDFYEYDPSNNTWTGKASFAGGVRSVAVGFSIGNKGYIGTGLEAFNIRKDFWEFDPSNNSWTQRADFGGTKRIVAFGFSIGTKGFIGGGMDTTGTVGDLWEFDPSNNSWTQKANIGTGIDHPAVFCIGTKAYIGTGETPVFTDSLWEYDSGNNNWTPKTNFPAGARVGAVGFSIFGKGYLGTGWTGSGSMKDFWEYDPNATSIPEPPQTLQTTIYPNPMKDGCTVEIYNLQSTTYNFVMFDLFGKQVFNSQIVNRKLYIPSNNLPSGVYFYQILSQKEVLSSGKLIIQ